jgi:ferredoxin
LGRIISSPEGSHTQHGNVFVAGDICADNHNSLIGAIASGKNAAVGVRSLLEGYTHKYEGFEALKILNQSNDSELKPKQCSHDVLEESYIKAEMPKFDLFQACAKCDHCIENFGCPALVKNNGQVVIDEFLCTNCGLCIDVCINDAIHWVKKEAAIQELIGDAEI